MAAIMTFHRVSAAANSKAVFYCAHDQASTRNLLFLDIMNGPNPLTANDIRVLAVRHPERRGAYVEYADAMDNTRNKQRVA